MKIFLGTYSNNKTHYGGTVHMSDGQDNGTIAVIVIISVTCVVFVGALVSNQYQI